MKKQSEYRIGNDRYILDESTKALTDPSNDNDQIAAASDLGGMTIGPDGTVRLKRRNPPLVDRNGLVIVPDDATRTLERVKALLVEALKESATGRPGWGQTYAAWQEIEALEARREAGRDG